MQEKYTCPCCGKSCSQDNSSQLENVPLSCWPLHAELKTSVLHLVHCENCGHAFQANIKQEVQDYIYNVAYAESPLHKEDFRKEVYSKPFNEFFPKNDFSQKRKELLEIGCGDPNLLKDFAAQGFICTGIEPSSKGTQLTFDNNIHIINDYFENISFNKKFDVIILRFCLEHMQNVENVVQKCKDLVHTEGSIYVQVPNNEAFLRGSTPFFAMHEHTHYFTRQSLDTLFSRHGLSVKKNNGSSCQSLLGEYEKRVSWGKIYKEFYDKAAHIEREFAAFYSKNPHIIFYGWGLPFIWLSIKFDFSQCRGAIIDDEKILHGKKLNGTNLLVYNFDEFPFSADSIVLLTLNEVYHQKILKKIQDKNPETLVYAITGKGIIKLH